MAAIEWFSDIHLLRTESAPHLQPFMQRMKDTPMPFAPPLPDTAPSFAYRAPLGTLRAPHGRTRSLHIAGAIAAAMVLALSFFAVQQGDPGSAAAALMQLPSVRPLNAGQTHSALGELTPAAFAIDAAKPFVASYSDAASATRAENCLTQAIYYEGALEPERGQRAIAQVVLNRVRHPAFPDTVCGVVFQGQERLTGCQFTFTCDGSRARAPVPSIWRRANLIAKAALGGAVEADVGLATHYHADYVMPYWSASLDAAGQIGRHLFYSWKGGAGQPAAFSMRYAGREPLIADWTPRPVGPNAAGMQSIAAAAAGGPITGAFGVPGGVPGGAPGEVSASPPASVPFKARPLLLAPKTADATTKGDGAK